MRRALLLLCIALIATPATAVELFGICLFRCADDDDDDLVEVTDPFAYGVSVQVAGPSALSEGVRAASVLVQEADQPAVGAAGLIATAKADYRRLIGVLYDRGYYAPVVSIVIDGREAADLDLGASLTAPAEVVIRVEPGQRYAFGEVAIVPEPPFGRPPPDEVLPVEGFRTGTAASAETVRQAASAAVEAWRQAGFPLARVAEIDAVADARAGTLDVAIDLPPGDSAFVGEVTVEGSRRVDAAFARYMTGLPRGQGYDPDRIEAAVQRLLRLNVYRSVRVVEGDALVDGALPITFEVQDRRPRRVGVGALLSSVDGLGVEAFWLHRNLFGRAERLRFDAAVSRIGADETVETVDPDDLDLLFAARFSRPGVISPDTTLEIGGALERERRESFRSESASAEIGLTRIFDRLSDGDLFLVYDRSRIDDDLGNRRFQIVGLEGAVTYDSRESELDATRGLFARMRAEPFYETEFGNLGAQITAEARTYLRLSDRAVLAGRFELGSLVGPSVFEAPPGLLFFSGGGGSVRGYEFESNALTIGGVEVGGRSLVELSVEMRVDLVAGFGLVGFVDTGYIGEESWFVGGSGETDVGVGLGLRYDTGIGPIRIDVARGLARDEDDPDVAIYLGLGQAF